MELRPATRDDLPFLEEFLAPQTWTGIPLPEILREAVTLFVVACLQPRPSFRPVILRAASDPTFHRQVADAAVHAEQAWRRLLLSRRDQDLLTLLIVEPPLPYTEISRRLGIPIGSIGPTRARCFARLRRELARLTQIPPGAAEDVKG